MQYIKKQDTPPKDWDAWFTKADGERSFDYKKDYSSLTKLSHAKKYLLAEQHGLCAYCQGKITLDDSSIEHVIPKALSKELSTNYYNLVLVCKGQQVKDPSTNLLHCDATKGDTPMVPLIFLSSASVTDKANHKYFETWADGMVRVKPTLPPEIEKQVTAYIDVLNLNHGPLRQLRTKEYLNPIIEAWQTIPPLQKTNYLRSQFRRILADQRHPYRQFLLIYLGPRIGIN
jgi:uncharacterized protein (TIGR02646 family)